MNNKPNWWIDLEKNLSDIINIVAKFNSYIDLNKFKAAYQQDDYKIVGDMLQQTWNNAPDKEWIHNIPSWHTFCNICSEYMFGESEDE